MTYQEKIKYAEEVVLDIKKGTPQEDIEKQLKAKGLYNADIEKVMVSAKGLIEEEYGEKIRTYMLDGTLHSRLGEFGNIDAAMFETLKERTRRTILSGVKKNVDQMAKEGKTEEEIVAANIGTYVSREEIVKQIESYKMYVEVPQGAEKSRKIFVGSAITIVSIFVLIFGYGTGWRLAIRIGFVILVFGFYNLIGAFSSKGSMESY